MRVFFRNNRLAVRKSILYLGFAFNLLMYGVALVLGFFAAILIDPIPQDDFRTILSMCVGLLVILSALDVIREFEYFLYHIKHPEE